MDGITCSMMSLSKLWELVMEGSLVCCSPWVADCFSQCVIQFSSVAQSCPTVCNPLDCSTPGFPVHHQFPEPTETHVHELVMSSNHLILCSPLLLLPSIFPSIRVFSNESVLRIRCQSIEVSASTSVLSMNTQE